MSNYANYEVSPEDGLGNSTLAPGAAYGDRHATRHNMGVLNALALLVGLTMTLGPLAAYALGAR